METLIIFGLGTAVLFTTAWNWLGRRTQPPQIIYVQAAADEPRGTGCMPLIVLLAIIFFALQLGS
ncbi:MAG: hypothetical protein EI684_11105 [Candidatus Viridilinea halotolerans]|uniref:Uncharacterized protein n=1 Tax=Candidatus Viridilinea halotolerans TaxID=2491704 RepID=A0A426TZL3_9CHLR|nr:MAG: hypothetical protein EI684_11105 [Candidatus Viridilinea halotolerans]